MAAVKTGLSVSAFTLDGNDHLADLQVFGMDIGVTEQESHGIAATTAYTQVTKKNANLRFEMLVDNSGPQVTNLDVSVWTPSGSSLLGDLQSGTLRLTRPTGDGSGLADVFEYANYVGARRYEVDTDQFIPNGSSSYGLLTNARSSTVADWTKANVLLTVGGGVAFDLVMTMGAVSHSGERDGIQTVKTNFKSRGTPSTIPSGTTFLGVAFTGDGTITLSLNTGAGTWSGDYLVTSVEIQFAQGQMVKVSGELAAQGQPGYS